MEQAELDQVLKDHEKWVQGDGGGVRADLSGADLNGANLRRANLSGANLSDADLSDADLSGADLNGAHLSDAHLNGANLNGAHLPKIMKVANLFTKINAQVTNGGTLEMKAWHTCQTTHCLAGWAINLAGDAGRVAENLIGPSAAAALIIHDSCSYLEGKTPNFVSSNEEGLKFISECAEKEADLVA